MPDAPHPTNSQPPSRPVWVKAFILIGILAVIFVVLSLTGVLPGGPGGHGPTRHIPTGDRSPEQSSPGSRSGHTLLLSGTIACCRAVS